MQPGMYCVGNSGLHRSATSLEARTGTGNTRQDPHQGAVVAPAPAELEEVASRARLRQYATHNHGPAGAPFRASPTGPSYHRPGARGDMPPTETSHEIFCTRRSRGCGPLTSRGESECASIASVEYR